MTVVEERALRRIRRAIGALTDADAIRAMIHKAHADVCPDKEIDTDLADVALRRPGRSVRGSRKPRKRSRAPGRGRRACEICLASFDVFADNPLQRFCSRPCSHEWLRRVAASKAKP